MTSKELAKLIGVSQSTISRALNGSKQISEQRRQEIIELAKKYNFEFNVHARNLRTQTSSYVGILMPVYFRSLIEDDFRALQFNYLYEGLSKLGFDPILLKDEALSSDIAALDTAIRKRQLAGLILSRRIEDDDVIAYLKGLSIPLFSMTRCNEKMQFIPSVSSNSYRMGYLIGEHFTNRGYKKIALIRIRYHQSGELTTQGFKDALSLKNVGFSDEDIFFSSFDFQSAYQTVEENLERIKEYDAIFAQNDTMALGVISALRDHHISVPNGIAVAGNNDIPLAQWFSPRLTTVHTSVDVQSQMACERIVSMIKEGVDPIEEKHFVVEPKLIIRESCP